MRRGRPEPIDRVIHELRGIKHALFAIAEFMLTQPTPGGLTPEETAKLQAKANAIKAKLDAAAAPLDAAVDKISGTT